tara:strand:+ start:1792 stop:2436 length:645 start_codon:yes stop_codon:yes gene_type:complete
LSNFDNYFIEKVYRTAIQSFIETHHYSHNTNGVQTLECFGLYREGNFGFPELIGAAMFAIPSMPATAAKYNPINPRKCVELRRLVCIDDTPKNTESWFMARMIKWLKQYTDYEVIVSFADKHHGHVGIVYKASNFEFLGETAPGRVLMVDGKEFHSRTLNQAHKPYSRRIKKRYDEGDKDVYFRKRKSKNIYVYYLNKGIRKKIMKYRRENASK